LPIVSATAPPIPESTSSNTSVATGEALAATSWMARLTRDSSPPEATLASGRSGRLGCDDTWNSMSSAPPGPASSSLFNSILKLPPAIASCCIAVVTALESDCAAVARLAESFLAAAS
jgi:hypothetical protein